MKRSRQLFLASIVVGPLHMIEQLLTGIDEFYSIRQSVASYYGLFDPSYADHASVLLITIIWTMVSLLFYGLILGGRPQLAILGGLGAFGVTELHHVVEAIANRSYDPGLITCVPYAIVGALLVAAVSKEWKRTPQALEVGEKNFRTMNPDAA